MKKDSAIKPTLVRWIIAAAVFLLCCVTIACLFFLYYLPIWDSFGFFLLALACLVAANALIFFFYLRAVDNERKINLLKLNEAKLAEQIKAAEDVDRTYREMRRIRHDIKNQYICVYQFINEGKYSQAAEYLGNIIGETEADLAANYYIKSGYNSLDAILNRISAKCAERNIDFSADIRVTDIGNIGEYHICSVAANLLNNALEASEKEQSPRIRFTFANNQNYVVIKTENSISQSVLDSNPQLTSTKAEEEENGLGIISVRETASKYDGRAEFYEDNGYFTAEIWLKKSSALSTSISEGGV